VLPDLASAIVRHPGLRVLVANGYYDQATPFHQTEYDLRHLGLPAQLHANVQRSYYEAGHMVYTSGPALRKFAADLRRFYAGETVEG
jgi:carboxypeptidase C (cathepsin A)